MRFKAPWARRDQEHRNSGADCAGAMEYFRKAASPLKDLDSYPYHPSHFLEQIARSPQQALESIRSHKLSTLSRLIGQYERLRPPPAAAECHKSFGRRLYAAKTAAERVDTGASERRGEATDVLFGMLAPQLTSSDGYAAFD